MNANDRVKFEQKVRRGRGGVRDRAIGPSYTNYKR